jgi:hypothetical protein
MADAVEVYPPAGDVVNVANMRHLWVLRDRLPFAWRGGKGHVNGAGFAIAKVEGQP